MTMSTTTGAAGLASLRRIGWGARGVFALGISASLAGNVLHAQHNPISQAISAWSPLALLLTVELISRIPAERDWTSYVRLTATGVIALIAAWVSYWHMAGVAARYGETGASPYLLPISVDGLIVVASISMVKIGSRIRALTGTLDTPTPATTGAEVPATPATDAGPAPVKKTPAKRATPRPATAVKVAKTAARMPGATVAEIAIKAGVSERTARRYLPEPAGTLPAATESQPAETPALVAA
ncbi:hypothetical protein Asp14428_45470 [Actinoplanes sp. NBRC 14428]|nr:hypothetical protein Asp14428_45470 [Actinoplanes sp. NBRC 14428]